MDGLEGPLNVLHVVGGMMTSNGLKKLKELIADREIAPKIETEN